MSIEAGKTSHGAVYQRFVMSSWRGSSGLVNGCNQSLWSLNLCAGWAATLDSVGRRSTQASRSADLAGRERVTSGARVLTG